MSHAAYRTNRPQRTLWTWGPHWVKPGQLAGKHGTSGKKLFIQLLEPVSTHHHHPILQHHFCLCRPSIFCPSSCLGSPPSPAPSSWPQSTLSTMNAPAGPGGSHHADTRDHCSHPCQCGCSGAPVVLPALWKVSTLEYR